MQKSSTGRRLLYVVLIPTLFAFIVRLIFGIRYFENIFQVMGFSFIFVLPAVMGFITVWFSNIEDVKKLWYRCVAPIIPVVCFFAITFSAGLEGLACWVMILPVFLIAAMVGGLIAGYIRLTRHDKNRFYVGIAALLPFILSPIEQSIDSSRQTYEAYTSIDIQAAPKSIWKNVTRVPLIAKEDDHARLTRFLRFPRPLQAELNYEGVGASREAIFDKGLVFHETVLEYQPLRKMTFSIKANPQEIPSTTMDEHIVIGGDYFDVLNGTYELQDLKNGQYRLHLYSHFQLSTHFNFYASIWARWIMQDIQNNILQVIKKRAEAGKSITTA